MLSPLQKVDQNKSPGASNSLVYTGKGFSFLEPEQTAEYMLLKNIYLEDPRPSFLCSPPSLVSPHWWGLETNDWFIDLVFLWFVESDVTIWGSLIDWFFVHCSMIGWTEPWRLFFWLVATPRSCASQPRCVRVVVLILMKGFSSPGEDTYVDFSFCSI